MIELDSSEGGSAPLPKPPPEQIAPAKPALEAEHSFSRGHGNYLDRVLAGLADHLRRVTVEVMDEGKSLGAGVLWPRGCVVTNAHVARRSVTAVRLADGRRLEGRLLARDESADLALLRVAGAGVRAAPIADSNAARVGALVVAMGHPLGVRGALTAGIIHAIGPITPGGRIWIQAAVRLAPGNSGGPLADASGRVMGLNAMVAGALALAIPMAHVERFVRVAGVELT